MDEEINYIVRRIIDEFKIDLKRLVSDYIGNFDPSIREPEVWEYFKKYHSDFSNNNDDDYDIEFVNSYKKMMNFGYLGENSDFYELVDTWVKNKLGHFEDSFQDMFDHYSNIWDIVSPEEVEKYPTEIDSTVMDLVNGVWRDKAEKMFIDKADELFESILTPEYVKNKLIDEYEKHHLEKDRSVHPNQQMLDLYNLKNSKWKRVSADEDDEEEDDEDEIRSWDDIEWEISSSFRINGDAILDSYLSNYDWNEEPLNSTMPIGVMDDENAFIDYMESVSDPNTVENWAKRWAQDQQDVFYDEFVEEAVNDFDWSTFTDEEQRKYDSDITENLYEMARSTAYDYYGELIYQVEQLFADALNPYDLFERFKKQKIEKDRRVHLNQEMLDVFDTMDELPAPQQDPPPPWVVEQMRLQSKWKKVSQEIDLAQLDLGNIVYDTVIDNYKILQQIAFNIGNDRGHEIARYKYDHRFKFPDDRKVLPHQKEFIFIDQFKKEKKDSFFLDQQRIIENFIDQDGMVLDQIVKKLEEKGVVFDQNYDIADLQGDVFSIIDDDFVKEVLIPLIEEPYLKGLEDAYYEYETIADRFFGGTNLKESSNYEDWSTPETEILIQEVLTDGRLLRPSIKVMDKIVRKGGTVQDLANWLIENFVVPYNDHIRQQWEDVSDEQDVEAQKNELRKTWKQQARKQFPFSLQKQKQYVQEMEQMQFGLLGDPEPENIENYLLKVENINWQEIYDWIREDLQYRGKMASSNEVEFIDDFYKKMYSEGVDDGRSAVSKKIHEITGRIPWENVDYGSNPGAKSLYKGPSEKDDRFYNPDQLSLFRELVNIDDELINFVRERIEYARFKHPKTKEFGNLINPEKSFQYWLDGYQAGIKGIYKNQLELARKRKHDPENWHQSKWKKISADDVNEKELDEIEIATTQILANNFIIKGRRDAFYKGVQNSQRLLDAYQNSFISPIENMEDFVQKSKEYKLKRDYDENQLSVFNEFLNNPEPLSNLEWGQLWSEVTDVVGGNDSVKDNAKIRWYLEIGLDDYDHNQIQEAFESAYIDGWKAGLTMPWNKIHDHATKKYLTYPNGHGLSKKSGFENSEFTNSFVQEVLIPAKEKVKQNIYQESVSMITDNLRDVLGKIEDFDQDWVFNEYDEAINNRFYIPAQLSLSWELLHSKDLIFNENALEHAFYYGNITFNDKLEWEYLNNPHKSILYISIWQSILDVMPNSWSGYTVEDLNKAVKEIDYSFSEQEKEDLYNTFLNGIKAAYNSFIKNEADWKFGSHGQNQMAIGQEVAETTFEGIPDSIEEEDEPEEKIINGKKWKIIRPKHNPQPAEYARPKGGWGFYSKTAAFENSEFTNSFIRDIFEPTKKEILNSGDTYRNLGKNRIQKTLKNVVERLKRGDPDRDWFQDLYTEKRENRNYIKDQLDLRWESLYNSDIFLNEAWIRYDFFEGPTELNPYTLEWSTASYPYDKGRGELIENILDVSWKNMKYNPEYADITGTDYYKAVDEIVDSFSNEEKEKLFQDFFNGVKEGYQEFLELEEKNWTKQIYYTSDEISNRYENDLRISKKDMWEAVLDGELGHDILTTGSWEEVKKQTLKWLKQLKNGYINKKNPHDNKKIDPEAREQDGHALEDLKLYEEKKRWSFHFDHGKHPYDLIIQPVGYKESRWKKIGWNIENDKPSRYFGTKIVEEIPIDVAMQMLDIERGREDYERENIDALVKSIAEKGFLEPVIIDFNVNDNTAYISEGNHRIQAAKQLGMEWIPARGIRNYGQKSRFRELPVRWLGTQTNHAGELYIPPVFPPHMIGIPVKEKVKGFEDGHYYNGWDVKESKWKKKSVFDKNEKFLNLIYQKYPDSYRNNSVFSASIQKELYNILKNNKEKNKNIIKETMLVRMMEQFPKGSGIDFFYENWPIKREIIPQQTKMQLFKGNPQDDESYEIWLRTKVKDWLLGDFERAASLFDNVIEYGNYFINIGMVDAVNQFLEEDMPELLDLWTGIYNSFIQSVAEEQNHPNFTISELTPQIDTVDKQRKDRKQKFTDDYKKYFPEQKESVWKNSSMPVDDDKPLGVKAELDYQIRQIDRFLPSFMFGVGVWEGERAFYETAFSLGMKDVNHRNDKSRFYDPDQLNIYYEKIDNEKILDEFFSSLDGYINDKIFEIIELDYSEEIMDYVHKNLTNVEKAKEEFYKGFNLAFTEAPREMYV